MSLAACAGSPRVGHTEAAKPADAGAEAARAAGASCALQAAPPSGRLSIEVAGVTRDLELVLPSGYDGRERFPVLFAWHGTSSSGDEFLDRYYGAINDGAAGRALIVAPDGLLEHEGEWAGMTRWQLSSFDGPPCMRFIIASSVAAAPGGSAGGLSAAPASVCCGSDSNGFALWF